MKKKISPSMMCSGVLEIGTYLSAFEKNGIEYLHIDVMDGEFVPNLMLGTDYVKSLRKASDIPLDVHLMIYNPENKIDWFDFQPGEYVAVHAESTAHVQRALQKINAHNQSLLQKISFPIIPCFRPKLKIFYAGVLLNRLKRFRGGKRKGIMVV